LAMAGGSAAADPAAAAAYAHWLTAAMMAGRCASARTSAASRSRCSCGVGSSTVMQRRKLKLKATVESSLPYYSLKRLVTGAFNVGLIGSTCTALP
jgi:hypothetical protein